MAKPKPLTSAQIKAIKDPLERRKAVQKWVEEQQARKNLDNPVPKPVKPPAGRTVPALPKNRKPIIKGGVVTGKREPYGTA